MSKEPIISSNASQKENPNLQIKRQDVSTRNERLDAVTLPEHNALRFDNLNSLNHEDDTIYVDDSNHATVLEQEEKTENTSDAKPFKKNQLLDDPNWSFDLLDRGEITLIDKDEIKDYLNEEQPKNEIDVPQYSSSPFPDNTNEDLELREYSKLSNPFLLSKLRISRTSNSFYT
ncbi:hypothetical protein TPHA_0G02230 [Tetrapisispora phaffii CBS 4417]|uniref:Uncharacterized protein n=1 Tax=Tetrapisispora phaffii (strain ATCC 24235 / CBS 4417 / NBRC 1672 / NRRL Y-8282 / UCD 70-5) TaxID=1071381 RepID=G8BVY1_TETPH|nr:hypothetical protein TPHA_0G02230 [Tetrapisispora phaffii CBS 4417]CCE64059.1 hypothetical protein TPHA_0G02230 [Tetrapisispora phaffii CBS 4417]